MEAAKVYCMHDLRNVKLYAQFLSLDMNMRMIYTIPTVMNVSQTRNDASFISKLASQETQKIALLRPHPSLRPPPPPPPLPHNSE